MTTTSTSDAWATLQEPIMASDPRDAEPVRTATGTTSNVSRPGTSLRMPAGFQHCSPPLGIRSAPMNRLEAQASPVAPLYLGRDPVRWDLTTEELLAAGLTSLKGIRRTPLPEPVRPDVARITSSLRRVAVAAGVLNFLFRKGPRIYIGSIDQDLLLICGPGPLGTTIAGTDHQEPRSYVRLDAFGDLVEVLRCGEAGIEFGSMGAFAVARIKSVLIRPQASEHLNGILWDHRRPGIPPLVPPTLAPWRKGISADLLDAGMAYVDYEDPAMLVAPYENPVYLRNPESFFMAQVTPSGIRLHPEVDQEIGSPPYIAICTDTSWFREDRRADLVLVPTADPRIGYRVDRSGSRMSWASIRLDGRLGWLRGALRFGPRSGSTDCRNGLLALRFPDAMRPRHHLREPHRVAYPAGTPTTARTGRILPYVDRSDPFAIPTDAPQGAIHA